jgi:sensor histidine kinase YesM
MKYGHFRKIDLWTLAVVIPLLVIGLNFAFFGRQYFTNGDIFLQATLLTGLLGLITWQIQTLIAVYLRKRFGGAVRTTRRVIFALIFFIVLSTIIVTLIFVGYGTSHFLGFSMNITSYFGGLVVAFIVNLAAVAINEASSGGEQAKNEELEAERLKRVSLQTQLHSLQQQINPHFLFNSLNSLSFLIGNDAGEAEKFVAEMSKVYRYVLRYKDTAFTDLATELRFIQSYFHLLKTRFGDKVDIKLSVEESRMNYLLPPLTLQLLIENSMKHNAAFEENPLLIEIFTNGENASQLTVRNNIQAKGFKPPSNKVGLKNIDRRYKLMKLPSISVEKTDRYFSVTLPLVRPDFFELGNQVN